MKQIKYHIEILCDETEDGQIIPHGCDSSVTGAGGASADMSKYPNTETIMMIWIGKYFSYPKKSNK